MDKTKTLQNKGTASRKQKMPSEDENKHPIEGWMVRQRRMIKDFKSVFPDEWETSKYCIAVAYGLIKLSMQLGFGA